MLAPAAPHITEELWSPGGGGAGEPGRRSTPRAGRTVDPSAIVDETREVPIQINGKVRDKVIVPIGIEPAELERVVARPRSRPRAPCRAEARPGDQRRRRPGEHRRPRLTLSRARARPP